jgi:hypothetical protein
METYIRKYKYEHLIVHFSTSKVDYQFFNFQSHIPNGKTLVLSYNFNEEELYRKIVKSSKQILKFNQNEKEPLRNIHNNIYENAHGFDYLVIEGIDCDYIKENLHNCLFPWGRKLLFPKTKCYFFVVNIPKGKEQELEYMIRDYISIQRICLPITKKKRPPKHSLKKSQKLLSLSKLFKILENK